jgi:endogenous inhibitor of DNA gyrase (YacG/DUF329 family)
MELTIIVECSRCGKDLDIDRTVDGKITIEVTPCPDCIKDAVDEAKEEMES